MREVERRRLGRVIRMGVVEADDVEAALGRARLRAAVVVGTDQEAAPPLEIGVVF